MRRHKHLKRLERLRDAINKRYGIPGPGIYSESDFPDEGIWRIWVVLLKDIKECGLSPDFKIDGIRLYYYNELWKMVNGKNHAPLDTPPKFKKDKEVYFHEIKFDGPMDRAEWLAKQPLPSYMWTEAK